MVERKKGHVVNIGSVAGNYALPGGNVYCGTKVSIRKSKSIEAILAVIICKW
jgi:NADP-dependent 3-hydroxy acid dehydrogenase YdfG